MVLPKEGSGYEMEANALTKKGARIPRPSSSSTGRSPTRRWGSTSKYFAAVGVAGFPVPEGLPKDISKVVYPERLRLVGEEP